MTEGAVAEAALAAEKHVFKINSGGTVEPFPYRPNETIEAVIVEAIARFGLAAQPHQLGLFKQGQTAQLERNLTLEKAGVKPGETLILQPIVVEGGEW